MIHISTSNLFKYQKYFPRSFVQSSFDSFEAGFNRLTVFLAALVAISIGLIAVFIPLSLFLVKSHLGSMWWLFGSIEYSLYFGVFAGAPWVLQQGAHVRVDIVTANVSASANAKLNTIINILAAVLCLLLSVYGIRAGIAEYIDQTMPDKDLQVANWIVVSVFAFSFLMLATEFLLRLRKNRLLKVSKVEHSSEAGL